MFHNRSTTRRRKSPLFGGSRSGIDRRQAGACFEWLEVRRMLSASWIGGTTGYWDVAANWSTGAVPTAATAVSISGATVTIAPGETASAGSLAIATGATLSMPAAVNVTNPTTNWIVDSDFEAPTLPSPLWDWGSSVALSTHYAYTGSQSLVLSGASSTAVELFPATPGRSYTTSVDAMTPNLLTGNATAYLNLYFFDSSYNQISSLDVAPNSIAVLTASSATGGPLAGSVGTPGWNHCDTTAVAPAGTAYVEAQIETAGGSPGTAVYFDDLELGPTPPGAQGPSKLVAGSISNSGTLSVGPANTVTIGGALTQTSTGILDIQLGGAPATGKFGFVNAAGTATLAGTLKADIVDGYSPSTTDVFTPIEFASESGSFAGETLPSGSGYRFNAAVTFTNVVIAAAPTTALSATVNASTSLHAVATNLLGVNLAYWDSNVGTTETQQRETAAGLDLYRFPGGSAADAFHFNVANNWGDSSAITIGQFAEAVTAADGTGMVTVDYGSGSYQEALAELAYLEGSTTDTATIGNGLEWSGNPATGQTEQTFAGHTVGYWASLRAAAPLAHDDGLNFLRLGHPAPFTNIKDWEIGNEEYGSWEVDHHALDASTGAAAPAAYAPFAAQFAASAVADGLPQIAIGIDSGDPTGASDGNWTKNVLADGLADGFIPAFISDHSYMQAAGAENDSFLLNDTVTDSGSVLNWSTRYADYQSVLRQTLGSKASSVQVMATEYNSVSTDPGKQSTSLVNGLSLAESLGGLLDSGYSGGFVWDLRNYFDTGVNNNNLLYGWREGGDYGLLGSSGNNSPPTTGPYVAYPGYYALQLASEIIQSGGQVVSATSNYGDLDVYAVKESSGDLALLVINVNPAASLTEQFDLTDFQPGGAAQVWQYGKTQDTAQSHNASGASALADTSTTLTLSGSTFSYAFPAYSMTVLKLSPPPRLSGPTTATVGHARSLAFTAAAAISLSDAAATASSIDTVALSVHSGTLAVRLGGGATITAGSSGSVRLTLRGTLTQLNAALGTLVYTAPMTGTSDTFVATALDGVAVSAPLDTTIKLTNIATTASDATGLEQLSSLQEKRCSASVPDSITNAIDSVFARFEE